MLYDPTEEDDELEAPSPSRSPRRSHLIDDLDTTEIEDDGRDLTEGASLATILEDPEVLADEVSDEEIEIGDSEIAEAESLDLSSFGRGRDRGYDLDAFEDWVRLSRKYGNLSVEQSERYVKLLQSDDPDDRAFAEDRLVAHSIRWIVRCLNEVASHRIMESPGDLRNDALSAAREGFLLGLRKYDPKKAEQLGSQGYKKTLLGFTRYWIRKIYLEWYYGAVLNLNADAAEDRKKVVDANKMLEVLRRDPDYKPPYREHIYELAALLEKQAIERLARKTLRAELRRKPTDEEFKSRCEEYRAELEQNRARAREQVARAELSNELGREPTQEELKARVDKMIAEKRWVDHPVPRALRRAGALTIDRIRDLLNHSIAQKSFDAPVHDDDDSGPKLREYIASSDASPEERIAQQQLSAALNARLAMVPGSKARDLYRQRYGFGPHPGESFPTSNPEELMYWMGRGTRDSVTAQENQVARELRGEVLVDPDSLSRPGFGFSPNRVRRLHDELARARSALETAEIDREEAPAGAGRMAHVASVAEARAKCAEIEAQIENIRQRIRDVTDLRRVVSEEGIRLGRDGRTACVFDEDCVGTLGFTATEFECSGCGRKGDLFDWLAARGISDVAERDVAAARAAIALPRNVEREGNAIVAIHDPRRRAGLKALLQ